MVGSAETVWEDSISPSHGYSYWGCSCIKSESEDSHIDVQYEKQWGYHTTFSFSPTTLCTEGMQYKSGRVRVHIFMT